MQDKQEDISLKELLYILNPRFKTKDIPHDNIPAITETISQEGLLHATASSSSTRSNIVSAEIFKLPAKKKQGSI